jgi:hypothetical protein
MLGDKTMVGTLNLSFVTALVYKFWQQLSSLVTVNDNLQIWQKRDRFGHSYWKIYDPKTRQFTYLASETEVRMWIEQKLYRY